MTKKTYEEFCTYVEETIPDRIPMDREAVARVKEVRKNNDIILKGLTIMSGGKVCHPCFIWNHTMNSMFRDSLPWKLPSRRLQVHIPGYRHRIPLPLIFRC